MIKVRLSRFGTKKSPMYRVLVADSRAWRDGRHLENIGTYNPRAATGAVKLDYARLAYWQSVGAQLSEEVTNLVKRNPAPAAPAA
ncbi:MAG: 30S ribosomal protein S16 [Myxococcales bacterium]|nr:30S ribosomal protein S16 [Myxococcales bacterium]